MVTQVWALCNSVIPTAIGKIIILPHFKTVLHFDVIIARSTLRFMARLMKSPPLQKAELYRYRNCNKQSRLGVMLWAMCIASYFDRHSDTTITLLKAKWEAYINPPPKQTTKPNPTNQTTPRQTIKKPQTKNPKPHTPTKIHTKHSQRKTNTLLLWDQNKRFGVPHTFLGVLTHDI